MANVQQNQEEKKFQSENRVEVVGTLDKIEFRDTNKSGNAYQTKDGIPMRMLTAHVTVAEGETHRIGMMAMHHYKNNPDEVSSQWKAFETFENEYVSIEKSEDSNSEHFGKTPDVVKVDGNFDANVFFNQAGEKVENTQVQGRFMNRVQNPSEVAKGATAQITGFVKADPIPEVGRDGEETGRYIVDFGIIDYQNKAIPIKLVAGQILDEDGEVEVDAAEFVEEAIEKGQTMTFNCIVINKYLVKKIERAREGGFGKKAVDTIRDITNEVLIEGGGDPVHHEDADEDEDKLTVVFPEQAKEALEKYNQFVAEREASSKNKKASGGSSESAAKKKGFGDGAAKKSTKKKSNIQDDDLPF